MKKVLFVLLLIPFLSFSQEISQVSFTCLSDGAHGPLSISFTTSSDFGGLENATGVLSSIGIQTNIFSVIASEVKNESNVFSLVFKGARLAADIDSKIEGKLTLNLKEVLVENNKIIIPEGSGVIDLTVRPTIRPATHVLNQYKLTDCVGMLR